MEKRKLWLTLASFLGMLVLQGILFNQQSAWASEGSHGGHQGMSFYYMFAWLLTIMEVGLAVQAYQKIPTTKNNKKFALEQNDTLALLIVVFVFFTFLVDMFPSSYHEPVLLGLLRMLLKLASGVVYLFFGLSYHYAHEDAHH